MTGFNIPVGAATIFLLGSISPLFGATIDWTTWTTQPTSTSAVGSITVDSQVVSVNYSGEIGFTQLNGTGFNYYLPLSTFTAPPTVSNAPVSDMIAIDGTATTHTITFGTAVFRFPRDSRCRFWRKGLQMPSADAVRASASPEQR
jgi:hypothetical protein